MTPNPTAALTHKLLGLLQAGLNRYLMLDPESAARLRALQGKNVALEFTPFTSVFHLHFVDGQIKLSINPALDAVPDTIIKGTPLRLAMLTLAAPAARQRFFADDVSMQGNLALGQQVIELFDRLQIDWEEYGAQLLGDVPAHHAGNLVRGATKWLANARATLLQNINEYTHEEIKLLPPLEALQDFFAEVDAARMALDRLSARVARLQLALAPAASKNSATAQDTGVGKA